MAGTPGTTNAFSAYSGQSKAERAALTALEMSTLRRERQELKLRCAQLRQLLARRTRTIERVRQEIDPCDLPILENAERQDDEEEEDEEDEEDDGDDGGGGGGGGGGGEGGGGEGIVGGERRGGDGAVASAGGTVVVYHERSSMMTTAAGGGAGGGGDGTFDDELFELRYRYSEMSKVARERQVALGALQGAYSELASTNRELRHVIEEAGLTTKVGIETKSAKALEKTLFGQSVAKFRPVENWPPELRYTNQLVWDEVAPEHQFLRDKIADPGSVRRKWRLSVVKIKSKKHPCCGEFGLFAAEDIPAGEALLDYAGKVKVGVADSKRGSVIVADRR